MLEKYIDSDFSGCISIKKEGRTIFSGAYGYAELADKIPNQINTRFATASAGKVFVATGILQMIEKGFLRMDDTIGKLIPIEWHDIDTEITVEQLLTHTSGIPDYFDENKMSDYDELWIDYPNYKIRQSADLLPLFLDKKMMYPKGEKFQYNNTGYVVLGMIIEAVTKESFDEYLRKNVFERCGMDRTGYYELDRSPENCASSYIWDAKRQDFYKNIYSIDVKGTGAGGAFTTIGNVEKFWEALLGYRLMSKEMTDEMLRIHAFCDHDDNYGYGVWMSKEVPENRLPYFTGSDPGVSFISSYDRKADTSITIVSNFANDVWRIHHDIRKELIK